MSILVALLVVVAFLGALASRAAYRNGFWDGVLWERERGDRSWPPATDVNHDLYTPGGESLYPSKPAADWHGESLADGARKRAKAKEAGR